MFLTAGPPGSATGGIRFLVTFSCMLEAGNDELAG